MVQVPVLILKDQIRTIVSSFSHAVEVATSTSTPNTWTEISRTLGWYLSPWRCFGTEDKSHVAVSVSFLLNCM